MSSIDSNGSNGAGWDMDVEHSHLLKSVADVLRQNDDALRIWCAREDKFFRHAGLDRAMKAIRDAMSRPPSVRPWCIAVTGLPNSGKTTMVRRIVEDIATGALKEIFVECEIPLISFEMPARPTEAAVALEISAAMGLTGFARSKARLVSDQYKRALKAKNVQAMIIDEFHNVKSLPDTEREILFNCIRGIVNMGIHVIVVGTEEVCVQIASDEQLASRFHHEPLVPISEEEEFRVLLATLEMHYPLPERSNLADDDTLAEIIRRRTNCVLGNVVGLCNEAAVLAIQNKKRFIDAKCLRDAKWKPVSGGTR